MSKSNAIHPVAELFPEMVEDEFAELRADIEKNGLLEPITMYKGQVVDGRHRFRACNDLKVPIRVEEWDDKAGVPLTEWVLSKNMHRRHLNPSQRAMIAAKVIDQFAEEAKARQVGKLKQNAEKTPLPPVGGNGEATEKAAAATGASPRSVERAKAIIDKGDKKLVAAVDMGVVTVSDAAKIVDKPKAEQRAAVKAVEEGKAKTVAAAVSDAAEPESKEGEPLLCALSQPIPKQLQAAFARLPEFNEAMRLIGKAKALIQKLSMEPVGIFIDFTSFNADISNARGAIKFGKPYTVCPYCKGKTCRACREQGWTTERLYKAAPKDGK